MQVFRLDAGALSVLAGFGLTVFAAAPAAAFDCAKASTRFEKAICANPDTKTTDDAMSAAFSALMAAADPKQRSAATSAQIAWLRDRDNVCDASKGSELSACLRRESGRRRAFLAGEPEQGPGAPGRLAPWFRYEKGGKAKAEVDMQLLKFVDPKTAGEKAFNAAVMAPLADIAEPEKDDPGADHIAYDATMRLVYASPKIVSAQTESFVDGGGAHPNTNISNVNLDISAGRLLNMGDLLDAKTADKVAALCFEQVKAAKKERMGADAPLSADDLKDLSKNVKDSTAALEAWSFEATQAVVTYNPYAVGSYAEGMYECRLPYDRLRPLAKPGFPLP